MNSYHSALVPAVILSVTVGISVAAADPISTEISVPGTTSIYQIFGNPGSVDDSATDAPRCNFVAGSNNVFQISADGGLHCCGDGSPEFRGTADGGNFFLLDTDIIGINGLSDAVGNLGLGLLAVFTSDSDPMGNDPPQALVWNIYAPTSLSPLLNQVFYVGDGREGLDDSQGGLLSFTAPPSATRLYLGFADGDFFEGFPSFYADNVGSMLATVYSSVSCVTAAELIEELYEKVDGVGPVSLSNKVQYIEVYYEVGDIAAAGAEIEGFEGQVRGLKGLRRNDRNRLEPELADELLEDAADLKRYIDYE
jgi:hypothetical protein